MSKAIVTLVSVVMWGAALVALPDAVETEQSNQDAVVVEHKLSLINEQVNDGYEQSEQAKAARHANQFLKANRSDGL